MKDEHGNAVITIKSGGRILVNPGTFGMDDATEEHATENMRVFIQDCDVSEELSFEREPSSDYGEGRYSFIVRRRGFDQWIGVQMPGRELSRVRYVDQNTQNIWDFPRLYVDDSSWVWKFAILQDDDWKRECPICHSWESTDHLEGSVWYCDQCEEEFAV